MKQPSQSDRARALYELYSRDISAEDLQRLTTLGATIYGAIRDRSTIFGRLSARDLYLILADDPVAGHHVALMNADYRWPVARPQRGSGTWPLFLHTVHAAVFADAGHAWTRTFAAHDLKSSVGGELSLENLRRGIGDVVWLLLPS